MGTDVSTLYPHFQVAQTDCPGASYSKVGLTTGLLNYNYVESSVTNILNGGVATMAEKPAVLVFGIWDLVNAYRLAAQIGCPVIPREAAWKTMGFNKFYVVGGP